MHADDQIDGRSCVVRVVRVAVRALAEKKKKEEEQEEEDQLPQHLFTSSN